MGKKEIGDMVGEKVRECYKILADAGITEVAILAGKLYYRDTEEAVPLDEITQEAISSGLLKETSIASATMVSGISSQIAIMTAGMLKENRALRQDLGVAMMRDMFKE